MSEIQTLNQACQTIDQVEQYIRACGTMLNGDERAQLRVRLDKALNRLTAPPPSGLERTYSWESSQSYGGGF